jgi:hypothetical protein
MKWMSLVIAAGLFLGTIGCGEKTTVTTKDGGKFSITAPTSKSLKPGESTEVTVNATRTNMDEDITVTFSNLPEGVTVDKKTQKIEKGKDKADFVLMAAADAQLQIT